MLIIWFFRIKDLRLSNLEKKKYPQAVMMFGSKNDHFKECCPPKNFGYGKDYPLAFKLIMSHGFVC